jgi:uncharacterized repeat protein (TIGR03803 family)
MNTTLRLLLIFNLVTFFSQKLHAQSEFWGTTRWGGANGEGVVFKTDNDGTNFQIVHSFSGTDGSEVLGGLIQAGNGKLYGVTLGGGAYSNGVLYEVDPATGSFTKKLDFDSINTGSKSMGTLFEASNGKLYGMTWRGGVSNKGVFYEYDIFSNTLTKIIDFDGPVNGSDPNTNTLMEASNGKLYGTTQAGGANGVGVLFEYDPVSGVFTKKIDFVSASSGSFPGGRLTEVSPGILYGATRLGGTTDDGVIFEYAIGANSILNKINLSSSVTGNRIYDGLMLASNGRLYGLAQGNGQGAAGTMIEFDIPTATITKVVDFGLLDTGVVTTWEPYGSPMQASNGKIYGTGAYGGNGGDLFEYDFTTDTYIPLFDFGTVSTANSPYHLRLIEVNTPPASVWPGDCNYDLTANNIDFLYLGLAWNETGPARAGASTNWVAQPAAPWSGAFPSSLNHKHADTNGDGIVNVSDSVAIYQNYGQSHPLRLGIDALLSAGELFLVPNSSAIAPGQSVSFDIHVSDVSTPLSSLYGIAFTLTLDPALIDTSQVIFDYSSSVLGNIGSNMIAFEKNFYSQGVTEAAVTRTDQANAANVHGILGTLTVTTLPGISSLSNLVITPSDIFCINTSGVPVTLTPVQDSIVIDPALSGVNDINEGLIRVYPNPAVDALNIHSEGVLEKIELTNANGALVYQNVPGSNSEVIQLTALSNGFYILKLYTGSNPVYRKIVVNH